MQIYLVVLSYIVLGKMLFQIAFSKQTSPSREELDMSGVTIE